MSKNNLTKNTLLLSIGTMMTKGITFIMIPFFSRWLSTSDYGTFDLICTYVTMLIPLISLSTGEGVFRFGIDEKNDEAKSIYITDGLIITIIGLALLAIVSIVIANFTNWVYIIPFAVLLAGELLNKYLQSFLRAIKKLDIYSFTSAITTILIFGCVTLLVKVFNLGLTGMIYGYAFGYILGDFAIIFWANLFKYITPNWSTKGIKQLVKYSLPLIPNSISWWIINVSDRSIINTFLGASSNGIYAIAYKVPNLATSIFNVFGISWQETATEMVDADERNKYFCHVYNKMFSTLLSLCIGILSCNFILFGWLFDLKYYQGHLFTPILIASVIFSATSTFFGGIQISFKDTKVNGLTSAIGALINIIIHLGLIRILGLYAAAISTLLSTAAVSFLRHLKLKEKVQLKLTKINCLLCLLFIYFGICAYYEISLWWNVANLFIAGTLFCLINKELFAKFLKKINHVRK